MQRYSHDRILHEMMDTQCSSSSSKIISNLFIKGTEALNLRDATINHFVKETLNYQFNTQNRNSMSQLKVACTLSVLFID